jgi:hypothetical protein
MGGFAVQLAQAAGLRVMADVSEKPYPRGSGQFNAANIGREVLPTIREGGQLVTSRKPGMPEAPPPWATPATS